MVRGQRITYVDPAGFQQPAVVEAVTGTGASGFKVLRLAVLGGIADDVPHENDDAGAGFWRLGEPAPTKRRRKH